LTCERRISGIVVKSAAIAAAFACVAFAFGCRQDMQVQPRYNPYDASTFFDNGLSARQPVPGTIARGQLHLDSLLYTGKVDGRDAEVFPFPIKSEDLARGRERFNIYCAPCHDATGSGRGMIVLRGFPQPPSFHIDRLRQAPPGHFFDVMTNGLGVMYSYASRVSPEERWRIAAYIRALQLSQQADLADAPAAEREKLQAVQPK
jgi:mono/diheme cytochrome c family protein